MTILSVTEKIYNLFWNESGAFIFVLVGIAFIAVGLNLLFGDGAYVAGPIFAGLGLILIIGLSLEGKQGKYQIPYNTYEVTLDESVAFLDPITDDFKIERKDGETSIFTVTPIIATAKVPTFEVGEYINTKEYVNNESD